MRLTRTSWVLLSIGIVGITLVSLGATNSQQRSEGKKLSQELAVAQGRLRSLDLKDLYAQQESLGTRITQAKAQAETGRTKLALPNDSIFAVDSVFDIAAAAGVEINQMTSSARANSDLERVVGSVLSCDVVVTGEVPNLIDFITKLNYDFPTSQIRTAEISNGGSANTTAGAMTSETSDNTTEEPSETSDNTTPPPRSSAHVQWTIYSNIPVKK